MYDKVINFLRICHFLKHFECVVLFSNLEACKGIILSVTLAIFIPCLLCLRASDSISHNFKHSTIAKYPGQAGATLKEAPLKKTFTSSLEPVLDNQGKSRLLFSSSNEAMRFVLLFIDRNGTQVNFASCPLSVFLDI